VSISRSLDNGRVQKRYVGSLVIDVNAELVLNVKWHLFYWDTA